MKKQTSVEWFNQQIIDKQNGNGDLRSWDEIFEQAKQMEKEQIIQAITKTIIGSNVIYDKEYPEVIYTAEQYYNETYKGGEQ